MRFKEAYQLIDAALLKANLGVPVTPSLKALTFDRFVKSAGKKMVRDVSVETISASNTNKYIMTNSDYDGQIIKVEQSGTMIPFIGEKNASLDADDGTVASVGYWTRRETDYLDFTFGLTEAVATIIKGSGTSVHGLTAGEFVRFSEVTGFLLATGDLSDFNGITLEVASVLNTQDFTVSVDSDSYVVGYTSGGIIRKDNRLLLFNRSIDGDGGDLKVYYYSAPRAKTSIESEVDVPDLLIWSALYDTVAEFLNIDGQLQLASGYRGLAKKNREDYKDESRNREPSFDRLIIPMQEFNAR